MYEIFDHTADLGIRIQADDLDSLFAQAGRALFSVIVENLEDVRTTEVSEINILGQEKDFLLLDWLGELLFAFESRRLLFKDFDVVVDDRGLHGKAMGERLDMRRHRLEHEIKAITYHGLKVDRTDHAWLAEVIVDI